LRGRAARTLRDPRRRGAASVSDELARVLAFAYRRRGVDIMERSKLLHLLTFDLRWFSPDPAKRILARALGAGLLQPEGDGMLRVAFDVKAVDMPLNFRPREGLVDETGPVDVPHKPQPQHEPPPPPGPADAER